MAAPEEPEAAAAFDHQRHVKYWQRCHGAFLPTAYTAADSTRLTFACFILSALDLLSVPLATKDRAAIRRWVLSLQHPDGGFCGSSTHALPGQQARQGTANVAATFFALVLLSVAADGEGEARTAFAGVDRRALLRWLRRLQRPDGSFGQNLWEGEPSGGRDMRHSYLASCVRWMVRGDVKKGDALWEEDVDVESMIAHVRRTQSYDGGMAESAEQESHGGYVFCAVAALSLLDRAPSSQSTSAIQAGIPEREGLLNFLAKRQFGYLAGEDDDEDEEDDIEADMAQLSLADGCPHVGFNGRWNKKADTCYTWWAAGTLEMLDNSAFINKPPSRRYLLDITQHRIGGFSKNAGGPPDLHHSYLGLAALATMGEDGVKEFDVGLCCSMETTRKIELARGGLLAAGRDAGAWDDRFWDN